MIKVKITDIPVRINGERYYPGTELEVTEDIYKTMKSVCIIVDDKIPVITEEDEIEEVVKEEISEDDKIKASNEYKTISKEKIMIDLAEKGIEYDPNKSKLELFKMLGSD